MDNKDFSAYIAELVQQDKTICLDNEASHEMIISQVDPIRELVGRLQTLAGQLSISEQVQALHHVSITQADTRWWVLKYARPSMPPA